jgi:hypothetical protein
VAEFIERNQLFLQGFNPSILLLQIHLQFLDFGILLRDNSPISLGCQGTKELETFSKLEAALLFQLLYPFLLSLQLLKKLRLSEFICGRFLLRLHPQSLL